jgi:HSP20 family protein
MTYEVGPLVRIMMKVKSESLTLNSWRRNNMRLIRYQYPTPADFEQFFGSLLPNSSRCGTPATNLTEDENNYVVRVELPGVRKEDVTVELENNELTVRATRTDKTTEGESKAEFSREFTVPEGVDATKVKAAYENGVLTLTLPKPEAHKPRRIDVQ